MSQFIKTLAVVITATFLASCASLPKRANDLTASSVKITNLAGNSGGSGIILRSSDTNSYVLTNAHVCGVAVDGGLVDGEAGSFMVMGYKKSEISDLCLIKVAGNLGYATKLSKRMPRLYHERASISGHPALMPTIVSEGRFSGRAVLPILVGFKPCKDADFEDPEKAPMCVFLGGLPIIKSFESILVGATIMPGSSGSGVYNQDGELSGVVFAGSGQLGYAWTVPYEQVLNFLYKEQKDLSYERPTNIAGASKEKEDSKKSEAAILTKLKNACESSERHKVAALCELLGSDAVVR